MKTKYSLFLAMLLLISTQVFSQAGWLTNLQLAQNTAKATNKLVLIDFWATWCGPCKKMDMEVWSTEEAQKIKQNFVPVKIDIDAERAIASQYNIRSIPNLILMDYKGRVIHSYVGYSSKSDLLDFIKNIPVNTSLLNEKLATELEKEDLTFIQGRDIALAYQDLSKAISHASLKQSFLQQSERHFKKAAKKATSQTEINEIELWSTLNGVIRGRSKKVVSTIQETKSSYENTPNEPLMNYVLLCAYKEMGDTDSYATTLASLKAKPEGERFAKLVE